jgi:hypothetical protein
MLSVALQEELDDQNVSLDEFSELIIRLMDYGVLSRDESQKELQLYDRYLRIEGVVRDYLSIMHIRLKHESRFQTVRLFPPGAEVPGMESIDDAPFNSGLRARLSQLEIALILVLRTQYDKAVQEAQIDELGCATLALEALGIAFKNLMHKTLPSTLTERRILFRRLKQFRVIDYPSDDAIDSGEAWIKVRPLILSYVSEEVLSSIEGLIAESQSVTVLEQDEGENDLVDDAVQASDDETLGDEILGDETFGDETLDIESEQEGETLAPPASVFD